MQNLNKIIRNKFLSTVLCLIALTESGCKREVTEPEHKNNGCNVAYLAIGSKQIYLKDSFLNLNRKTKGSLRKNKFDKLSGAIFTEYNMNDSVFGVLNLNFESANPLKSGISETRIKLQFNSLTKKLWPGKEGRKNIQNTDIFFTGYFLNDNLDKLYSDTIFSFRIEKWDRVKRFISLTFETGVIAVDKAPEYNNQKLYFYTDINY